MNMKKRFSSTTKKKLLTSAILLSVGGFTSSVHADLSNGSLGLSVEGNLNPSCLYGGTYPGCTYGAFDTAEAGSFFTMDGNPGGAVGAGAVPLFLDATDQSYNGPSFGPGNAYAGGNNGPVSDWAFFGNIGTNSHAGLTVSNNDTDVNMSNWSVNWGEVPFIDMGSPGGVGTLVCTGGGLANECEAGETFTLDYDAVVPAGDPSGFGGVAYSLHLQGTVISTNKAPVEISPVPLATTVHLNSEVRINLPANVMDPDGDGVDNSSFQLEGYVGTATITVCTGSATPNGLCAAEGDFIYKDNDNAATAMGMPDTFDYSVADTLGDRSLFFTVEVTVRTVIPPLPQPIPVVTNINQDAMVLIPALTAAGDFAVDATSVVVSAAVNGTLALNAGTGEVTFTPTMSYTGPASFSFTIDDNDGGGPNTSLLILQPIKVNDHPVAGDTVAAIDIDRNSSVVIDILALTSDSDGVVDPTSVVIVTDSTQGTTSIDLANGDVTYTPTNGNVYLGGDFFTYTVVDDDGAISNPVGTVNLTINNATPIAVDDNNKVIDITVETSITVDVVSNDTDSDGTVDVSTVVVVGGPSNGIVAPPTSSGEIIYTPTVGYIGGDAVTYTVLDNDGDVSNIATLNINVKDKRDFCEDIPPLTTDTCFLQFDPGNIQENTMPVLGDGSYFSMEVQPGVPTLTAIEAKNALQLNAVQLASTAPLSPNIDQPWIFFGNIGVHQSTIAPTVLSDNGTGTVVLDFSGWNVSWNSIPSITLNAGDDNGLATMFCYLDDVVTQTQGDCSAGNAYVLDYRATVPVGDPSGFGGVKYALHLEGIIAVTGVTFSPAKPPNTTDIEAIDGAADSFTVLAGSVADAAGNVTGTNLSPADVGVKDPLLNPADGQQCLGGCIDFVVSGFSGDYVDIIYRLSAPLTQGAIYRKLISGIWGNFDTGGDDQLGSNAEVSGVCTDDQFSPGLSAGDQCIFMRIYDGGPNDADGEKNGTIVDPSGALVAGSPNTPAATTNGCSISNANVDLTKRADWLIIFAFIAMLGWISFVRGRQGANTENK